MSDASPGAPREPGQSAFAAFAEFVELLRSDPATDWSKVDIEALRRHLILRHCSLAIRPAQLVVPNRATTCAL